MARKNKEKEIMFEKGMEFSSAAEAKAFYDKADKKFKFTLICSAIASLGSVVWALSKTAIYAHPVGMEVCDVILKIALLAMLVCTNVNYLRYLWKSIKITWFIVPIFPIDVFFAVFGAAAFLIVSLIAPVVPCLMTLYQAYINKKEAEKYLSLAGGFNSFEAVTVEA